MKRKKWTEYTENEKINLLKHWRHYYGKLLVTYGEIIESDELIKKYPNKIFHLAVCNSICNIGSDPLILSIRKNKVNELLNSIENLWNCSKTFEIASDNFLDILIESYNNPKPDVPMSDKEIKKPVTAILKNRKTK